MAVDGGCTKHLTLWPDYILLWSVDWPKPLWANQINTVNTVCSGNLKSFEIGDPIVYEIKVLVPFLLCIDVFLKNNVFEIIIKKNCRQTHFYYEYWHILIVTSQIIQSLKCINRHFVAFLRAFVVDKNTQRNTMAERKRPFSDPHERRSALRFSVDPTLGSQLGC